MLASSRGTLCRANARGRNKSRPYGQILCFGPTGMAPPTRAAVGRDALIPPHPAPPRTTAGGYGIRPYNQRRARGQLGNRKPCVTSNPCRGRCSNRPGRLYAARTPAGGINPAPTNKFVLWTNRDGPAHPGGRRAGCPHPAAPRAAANPRGRDKSRPYNQRRARGQPGNRKPCVTSTPCRGRCSHRPGNLAPPHGSLPIQAK